jgi:hypothetical protein
MWILSEGVHPAIIGTTLWELPNLSRLATKQQKYCQFPPTIPGSAGKWGRTVATF